MAETITTVPDNQQLDISSMAHTLGYDAGGNLITDTVVLGSKTYVQTLTRASSAPKAALIAVSQWTLTP